jgi:hypothetical protein
MISDVDIDRSAWVLIRRHGDDAMLETAIRADDLLESADFERCCVWHWSLDAIERLQAKAPVDGEAVH